MAEIAGNTHKVYIANGNSAALAKITKAVCVILPVSFAIAGYNDKGDVLVIDRFEDVGNPWETDYLRAQLENKSLQNLLKKAVAVFVDYDKNMLVPKALYQQGEAEKWMRQLHFVEMDEKLLSVRLQDDKTQMLYTVHAVLKRLTEKQFAKAKVLPLGAYQFHRVTPTHNLIQCCITDNKVFATCYLANALHWHQVFAYETAEDIAYKFSLLLQEHNVAAKDVMIECAINHEEQFAIAERLKLYFPQMEDCKANVRAADSGWAGMVYLLQQMYSCV